MKSLKTFAMLALIALTLHSCTKVTGEGPVVSENRNINNFSKVAASFSGEVIYSQAPDFKVEIQAQQNIIDVLETPVINNELVVRYKKGVNVRSHEDIKVLVSSPMISSL